MIPVDEPLTTDRDKQKYAKHDDAVDEEADGVTSWRYE